MLSRFPWTCGCNSRLTHQPITLLGPFLGSHSGLTSTFQLGFAVPLERGSPFLAIALFLPENSSPFLGPSPPSSPAFLPGWLSRSLSLLPPLRSPLPAFSALPQPLPSAAHRWAPRLTHSHPTPPTLPRVQDEISFACCGPGPACVCLWESATGLGAPRGCPSESAGGGSGVRSPGVEVRGGRPPARPPCTGAASSVSPGARPSPAGEFAPLGGGGGGKWCLARPSDIKPSFGARGQWLSYFLHSPRTMPDSLIHPRRCERGN